MRSAADAQRVLEAARPDVVTVEVNLPDGDGLRLARELRDRYADLGIVILAAQGQDDVLFRALETGVSAFVGKTAPVEEMLAASSFTASGLAVALARRQNAQERLALSPRETEVLGLLGDGLSIPAIALQMFISQSTAKTYVARLYEKLGAANRAQALMTAIHYGLIRYSGTASYDGDHSYGNRVVGTFRPRVAGEALGGRAPRYADCARAPHVSRVAERSARGRPGFPAMPPDARVRARRPGRRDRRGARRRRPPGGRR
jgi:DNA-binding NarL/FixJ family response regulator